MKSINLDRYLIQAESEEKEQEQRVYERLNEGSISQRFSGYLLAINRLKRFCNIAKFCSENELEIIAEAHLESARDLLRDLENNTKLPAYYGTLIDLAKQEIYFKTITESPQLLNLWHEAAGIPA